jgi:hypothetical protein
MLSTLVVKNSADISVGHLKVLLTVVCSDAPSPFNHGFKSGTLKMQTSL